MEKLNGFANYLQALMTTLWTSDSCSGGISGISNREQLSAWGREKRGDNIRNFVTKSPYTGIPGTRARLFLLEFFGFDFCNALGL